MEHTIEERLSLLELMVGDIFRHVAPEQFARMEYRLRAILEGRLAEVFVERYLDENKNEMQD